MAKTVLVLDDHGLFAVGMAAMLDTLPDTVTCLARADAEAAVNEVERDALRADLFVVDFYLPGCHSPDLVRRLRAVRPDVPVLMVSGSLSIADRQAAMDAGALGFLPKTSEPADILAAIGAALDGKVLPSLRSGSASADLGLTARQLEIVTLISKGFTNKEIAKLLEVSPETIKSHVSDAFRRLNVTSRVEAIARLRDLGIG